MSRQRPSISPIPRAHALAALVAVAAAAAACDASDGGAAEVVTPAYCALPDDANVTLPADDGRHDAEHEWYYWTGHLTAEDGRRFGYQVTIVAAGAPGSAVLLAHHALTDEAGQRFHHGVAFGLETSAPPVNSFAFDLGDVSAVGGGGADALVSVLPGTRLTLQLDDPRGPVVRHGNGFQDYGGGIFTWYYARPRMRATGTIEIGGEVLAVEGTGWFDHQWGTLALGEGVARWDWVALQLDDGREAMVFQFPGGPAFAEVTEVDCATRLLITDVTMTPIARWTDPSSGCVYPIAWELDVDGERFEVRAMVDDQVLSVPPQTYWEGAATVDGDASGRGYIELVGYCDG